MQEATQGRSQWRCTSAIGAVGVHAHAEMVGVDHSPLPDKIASAGRFRNNGQWSLQLIDSPTHTIVLIRKRHHAGPKKSFLWEPFPFGESKGAKRGSYVFRNKKDFRYGVVLRLLS